MTFEDYYAFVSSSANYPVLFHPVVYPALGLVNEAGEVAGALKKAMRDGKYSVTRNERGELALELGDTLWYLTATARELGLTLQEIAILNVEKLRKMEVEHAAQVVSHDPAGVGLDEPSVRLT